MVFAMSQAKAKTIHASGGKECITTVWSWWRLTINCIDMLFCYHSKQTGTSEHLLQYMTDDAVIIQHCKWIVTIVHVTLTFVNIA